MTTTSLRDPYIIEEFIARGNFGEVYKARHPYLSSKVVALKLVKVQGNIDEALDEARKASDLSDHENVVKVHDAGIWPDGRVFIASDLCEFGSLDDRLIDGAMDPGMASEYIAAASRGLNHVHQSGLLHLDLRPANIMLGEGNVPKLTDFGLAKWISAADVEVWYAPHAAPEFIESGTATVSSDVYAMGMTLAHLVTGGAICAGVPSHTQLLTDCANGDWPRTADLGPNVPPRLRRLLESATDYDPANRPTDVNAFKRELDRATPHVSLTLYEDGSLANADGTWAIRLAQDKDGTHAVEVKRSGRVRSKLSTTGITEKAARKHLAKVVQLLAEEKPGSAKL